MVGGRLATLDDVSRIADELDAAPFVALDTEFHPERRYLPQLYLVQIATSAGAHLFDALEPEPLLAIAPKLRAKTWLVHAGLLDLRLLERAIGGASTSVIDVQLAAGLVDTTYPAGLGAVMFRHLGVTLAKTETLSDWSRRPLSREQLAYAADDVLGLGALWARLSEALEARGRADLARQAFAEAWKAALDPDPQELWRELPGAGALEGRVAATLRALAAWRDEIARVEDQPARVLIPDGVLLEFARSAPRDLAAIQRDRRVSKGLLRNHGASILAAIASAADAPAPPTAPRGSAAWRIACVLEAIVEVAGERDRWAPRLVAPRTRLDTIAATPGIDRGELAARLGWRDALVGDLLFSALSGRCFPRVHLQDVILGG